MKDASFTDLKGATEIPLPKHVLSHSRIQFQCSWYTAQSQCLELVNLSKRLSSCNPNECSKAATKIIFSCLHSSFPDLLVKQLHVKMARVEQNPGSWTKSPLCMPHLGSVLADVGGYGPWSESMEIPTASEEIHWVNGTGHSAQVKHELNSLQHQCHSKNFLNQFILGELSGARAAYRRVATISSFKMEALLS